MSIARTVAVMVLSLTLAACGADSEDPTDAGDGPTADGGAASVLDALPEKDSTGLDLCAVLPGSEVAAAVGLALLSTRVEPLGINCSYFVGNSQRISAAIKDRMTYDAVRAVAEGFDNPVDDLAGLGVAAYTKKSADGDRQVWVVRRDGLYVEVQAHEHSWAEAVARLALERIP